MGKKTKNRMPISERAKQFSPFAAVTGLEAALERKERELAKIEKTELSEEDADKLNKALSELKKGDKISVRYYRGGEYLTAEGTVTVLDKINKILRIEETTISFNDLYKIAAKNTEG
ncbi:MAG: YolD-like family protein [Bacteroides sp.]|nr:YolD-like family protein [Bacteroides sp.]